MLFVKKKKKKIVDNKKIYMYILYPAIQQRIRGTENGSVFIGKDWLVKCLAMSLLIVELINHVNNFTALVVNFTDTVVGSLCENI